MKKIFIFHLKEIKNKNLGQISNQIKVDKRKFYEILG